MAGDPAWKRNTQGELKFKYPSFLEEEAPQQKQLTAPKPEGGKPERKYAAPPPAGRKEPSPAFTPPRGSGLPLPAPPHGARGINGMDFRKRRSMSISFRETTAKPRGG